MNFFTHQLIKGGTAEVRALIQALQHPSSRRFGGFPEGIEPFLRRKSELVLTDFSHCKEIAIPGRAAETCKNSSMKVPPATSQQLLFLIKAFSY